MTATTTNVFDAYPGDDLSTVFNVNFQFWDNDEVTVYLRVIATGVETLQIETTHYTLSGAAGSPGQVTFLTAPTSLQRVYIRRVSNLTQQNDIEPTTKLPSAAIEESLDRGALRSQEEVFDRARSMLIPVTDEDLDMSLPNAVARGVTGAVLGFGAEGLPIITTAGLDTALTTAYSLTLLDDPSAKDARATLLLDGIREESAFSSVGVSSTDPVLLISGSADVNNLVATNVFSEGQRLQVIWDTGATFDVNHRAGAGWQVNLAGKKNLTGHTRGESLSLVAEDGQWWETSRSSQLLAFRSAAAAGSFGVTLADQKLSLTGSTDIDNITGGIAGQEITILWAAAATFNLNDLSGGPGQLNLDGSANYTTAVATDTLTLFSDGTDWYEKCRGENG